MEFDNEIRMLSHKFYADYNVRTYPEILRKNTRPYNAIIYDSHYQAYICIPFRTNVRHDNSYHLTPTILGTQPGLDYSKAVIVKDSDTQYIDKAINIDQSQYNEFRRYKDQIHADILDYIDTYIDHITGKRILRQRTFDRKYRYATLKYFHSQLGIQ